LFLAAYAQTTQVEFGQNRVQYKKFNWQYLETANFDLYFYDESKEIAKYIQTITDNSIENLISRLGYSSKMKFDIIVFSSCQDFEQTNIGLNNEVYNIGGTTKINENKIFIYFDGNHQTLQKDLNKALVDILVKQMMRGGSLGQKLSNLLFLRLPDWYGVGVTNYIAYGWNTDLDDMLRQEFTNNKNLSFNQFAKLNPALAGQSFWYMLSEEFSENAISNILYLTRINHNVNSGFKLATNKSLENLLILWKKFYLERYQKDIVGRSSFPEAIILQKKGYISEIQTNFPNDKLAYNIIKKNISKINVRNLNGQHSRTILKNRLINLNKKKNNTTAHFSWSKDNRLLAVAYYKNGKNILKIKDFTDNKTKKIKIDGLEQIFGLDFSYNNNILILSAQKNGQTDLFQYSISGNTAKQLTTDIFDQLYPKVVKWNGEEKIIFSSNFPLNEIGNFSSYQFEHLDLFVSDLYGRNIERLTKTPAADEIPTGSYTSNQISFISDENGIRNQYIGQLSAVPDNDTIKKDILQFNYSPITNFSHNIAALNVTNTSNIYLIRQSLNKNKYKSIIYSENKLPIPDYSNRIVPTSFASIGTQPTYHTKETFSSDITPDINPSANFEISLDSIYSGDFPYTFQTRFNKSISVSKKEDTFADTTTAPIIITINPAREKDNNVVEIPNTNKNIGLYQLQTATPYKSKFATDYFAVQLDNSLLNTYQSVRQNQGRYEFPGIGILLKVGVSDVMDNHRLSGSFRVPFTFDGSEIALRYDALKHRVDGYLSFYSRFNRVTFDVADATGATIETYLAKTATYIANAGLSLPLNNKNAVKISGGYRNEQFNPTYVEMDNFLLKKQKENWITGKLEFVHDATEDIQFNIPKGLKFKTFFEYYKNLNNKGSNIYNIGFDLRYYLKIHRNMIWANRLAYASSFGTQKILYFLGGVDTWLNQKYNSSISIDGNTDFGLQAPVNNMRGLPQNIRNGNNYLLWNSELRWPLFSYFAKKSISSDFIRDFEIIGFFDAGMAYSEANPFNKENAYLKEVINPGSNIPLIITLKKFRNPLVYGFGTGIRTNVMGYFIRVDAGWGYDGEKLSTKPIWHISLSRDF